MSSFEENVLDVAGWGCYQKFLIGLSSIYLFCNGFAYLNLPSILPIAHCDLLMSENDILWIQSVNYFGMLCGGWFLGTLTDVMERIKLISITFIITFICSFVIGFTTEIYLLSCCSFVIGIGIAASFAIVKINLAEQLPVNNRGMCIILTDLFWVFGYLSSAAIGYILQPIIRNPLTNHPNQTWNFISWRIMTGFVAGFCLLASFTTALLQPNVRSLLSKRRKTTAHTFLKFIYAVNHSDHAEKYTLSVRQIQGYIKEFPIRETNITGCVPLCVLRTKRTRTVYKTILKLEYFKTVSIVTILRGFLFGGFFTCNLWLARNLTKTSPIELCSVSNYELTFLKSESCHEKIKHELFINFILLATCSIAVILFLSFLIDRVGRKFILLLSFLCCASCSLILAFFNNYLVTLILSIFFFMGYILINFTLDVVIIESVPTYTRGTALGISYSLQYLVELSIKLFVSLPIQQTFIIIGSFMFVGSVFSFFLPEYRQKPMAE